MRACLGFHAGVLFSVLLVCSQGCTPASDHSRPRVVVTTTMIADLVQQIGGPHVEVTGLMKAGVDPHQYKSSAGDARKMQEADLVVYNGLHLEGKMSDIFEQMKGGRVRVLAVASALEEHELRPAPEGFEGSHDPHIWFDVSLWAKTVDKVCTALIELDPAHEESYRLNASRYRKQLL